MTSSDEVVILGDSYPKEILGTNALGMKGYWIQGDAEKASAMVVVF